MTVAVPVSTDPIARRGERLGRVLPAPMVAVATLVSLLSAAGSSVPIDRIRFGLAVAAIAFAWSLVVVLRLHRFALRLRIVAVLGHLALAAVLVDVSGWFGIYAFCGYLLVEFLPRSWQRPALVVNALIVSAGQIGGYPSFTATNIGLYLGVSAVNVVLVLIFAILGERTVAQNEQLAAALAENAGLHEQLVAQAREAGVLDERQRLAGEIHDTVAQGLIGIVTQLEAAEQARHLPEQWQRHVAQARELARSNLTDARRSVQALRPEQLERGGLGVALAELAGQWRDGTARITVETTGEVRALPPAVEDTLFRVAQEALSNVAKHAAATKVGVTLSYLADVVLLDVRDDGCGLDPAFDHGGFGLDGMRQRLARVGGSLEIESAPGDGTALSAAVPR